MVWLGMRKAFEQAAGATVGGAWAAAALVSGVPLWVGVPVAVAGAAVTWLSLRRGELGSGFAAAAFTALFVQLVPFGDVGDTVAVRGVAVATGSLSGFLVNVLVSGAFSRSIFARRVSLAREHVARHLGTAVVGGPEAIGSVFSVLAELDAELETAIEELRWRRAPDRKHLKERRREVRALRHLAHIASEVHYSLQSLPDRDAATQRVLAWLADPASLDANAGPAVVRLREAYDDAERARSDLQPRG